MGGESEDGGGSMGDIGELGVGVLMGMGRIRLGA